MKLMLKRIRSRFNSPLPVGASEFETWADSIIELSGQFADKDSMLFAIASILIHADSKRGSMPKNHFVQCLRKSAANQVASQVFQDVKAKQAAQQAAALEAAKNPPPTAEATPVTESVAPDVKAP